MRDSRETISPRAFVAGYPIKHSRSPLIHGYWLSRYELDGAYEKIAVDSSDLAEFIATLKTSESPYCGGNITIPHKEAACLLADEVDPSAEELGAANTLWLEDGRLCAMNTDGLGFVANLDARRPYWDHVDRAVVLGAGGASRAVLQALRDRGISEIHVVNRTIERAQELVHRFGAPLEAHGMDALETLLDGAGLFVNTSSLGMDGTEAPHLPFERMKSDGLVTDIVYVPLKTPFLIQAEQVGVSTVDGLGMLLHQAAPGFEKWFGRKPEVTEKLRNLVLADIEGHS